MKSEVAHIAKPEDAIDLEGHFESRIPSAKILIGNSGLSVFDQADHLHRLNCSDEQEAPTRVKVDIGAFYDLAFSGLSTERAYTHSAFLKVRAKKIIAHSRISFRLSV